MAEKGRCSAACDCIDNIDIERGQLTERLIGPVDDEEDEFDGDFVFLIEGFQFILPDRSEGLYLFSSRSYDTFFSFFLTVIFLFSFIS